MKKKILSILKYILFLGIGVFLMWWQFSKMTGLQKEAFFNSLRNAHYVYIIPVFIMAILSHLSRAIRWKILIETMDYKPSTANTLYATLCGYFANTFVPRAGEILRCTLLGRYEKIPFTKLVGTIITERLFDFFCYLIIIVITILIQIETVTQFVKQKISQITPGETNFPFVAILFIIIAAVLIFYFAAKFLFIKYKDHHLLIKIKGFTLGIKEGLSSIAHLKRKKAFLGHTLFIWSMYLLQIYIGFQALSDTSHLGIRAAFSVLSLSTLAMIIAPGGLGAFPVAVQQVLLIYEVDNISFGWLMWGVTTGIVIFAGLISFALIIYTNKHKNEKNEQPGGKDS